ncbi:MAG: IclR family transcriptional regulator [Betaproteobacteria bacterium]|nr:IclR family transcriptional regulator [Betaproteobacteria bacterium]
MPNVPRTPHEASADARAAAPAGKRGPASVRTVQSLERAFAILEAIAGQDDAVGLADISRATDLHTSTAFHLLKTLTTLGYVRQDEGRRYRVGPRLFMQAAGAFTEVELVSFAMPFLRRLAEETGETAHLGVPAESGVAVIAKAEARSTVRTSERLGIIRPAHCTALGKVLLAARPAGELETYLRSERFQAWTPKTLTDPDAIRDDLRKVAAHGLGVDDAEFNQELRCAAAPVRNFMQQTVAAVGISGPVWRVTRRELTRLGTIVSAVADELSRDLGYRRRALAREENG